MNSEEINRKLYANGNIENYASNESYHAHLLEQYKIYQTSAENISNRRQAANAFFVTINTTLVSLVSYINFGVSNSTKFYWLLSIAGLAISYMWYRLVRSYKDLNSAKFKVIYEIEKSLPISPYDAEWEALGRGENSKLYSPFTHIEIYVPWVFAFLHFVVLVMSVYPLVKAWLCATAS